MWIQRSVQSGSFGFVLICWAIVDLRRKKKRVVRIVGMEAMGVLEKVFGVKIWEIWKREREKAMMVLVLDLCLFFGWHSNLKYVFFCSFVLFFHNCKLPCLF